MEAVFSSYRKRFPHKSVEDATRATRNWAEGSIKAFRDGVIDTMTSKKVERKVNELRIKEMRGFVKGINTHELRNEADRF